MKLLEAIEFDLRRGEHAQRRGLASADLDKPEGVVRLGHVSDFHVGKPSGDDLRSEQALAGWIADFERAEVDVLAVTGDLVDEPGDRRGLEEVERMLDGADFPYLVVPGNHDVPEPAQPGPFEKIFGAFPRVGTQSDVEFVLFDSMKGLPVGERSDLERDEAASTGFFSRGKVGEAQRAEVESQLDEAPRFGRVMLVHHHLRKNAPNERRRRKNPAAPKGLMTPLDDADELLDWATNHDIHLVLHGHKHDFWAPYEPRPGLIALNVGASTSVTKGRKRRGRIVDISPGMQKLVVRDVELE